jgi:hypothetical protein
MDVRNLAPPLLDAANADFIASGVSINASSRTVENIPVMARAVACRVSPDRRTVTLLFPTAGSSELLDGIRASRQIAVVFSRPSTHETVQLKGTDAAIVPPQKRDIKLIEKHCDRFVADLCPLGYDEALVRALMWFDPADLSSVTFGPSEAFIQTPGPRAGEPMKGGIRARTG